MFHWFSYRAQVLIFLIIIFKFVYCKWIFVADCFILHPVKLVVLYISCYALIFQPLIILFTSVTCICCNIIRLLPEIFNVLAKMINQCIGISGVLMDAIG